MVNYLARLTEEQRAILPRLQGVLRKCQFAVVNEFQANGYLRSHSVGLTTYRLPEIIVYGLAEAGVTAFFGAFFAALHDPQAIASYADLKICSIAAAPAKRFVPLLVCLFEDDFRLLQVWLPKRRLSCALALPGAAEYAPPRLWRIAPVRDEFLPPRVLAAEKTARLQKAES